MNKINRFQPTVFWSWNESMTESEIEQQICDMKKQGIGGFFIHSRGGLTLPYMGEVFFARVQTAIDCAIKYGLDVWLYDEDGWPSGFGGGKVNELGQEYWVKRLFFSSEKIKKENCVFLRGYETSKGVRYAYYEYDKHYVDLLSPDVSAAFISCTHEKYKKRFGQYFGKEIKGIFTDEPQLKLSTPYSEWLVQAFSHEHGYDMMEHLYLLDNEGDEPNLFRYHYYKTIAGLFEKNFTTKIAEWCEKNNLLFTGHFPCEDGLCSQYEAMGGVMRNYAKMQQPAIDFLGKRIPPVTLLKQLQSVKNQIGIDDILSETFGCSGWDMSFADLSYLWSYQAAIGINLPCLHLSAYSIKGRRKRDYPLFFSYQEPWWEQFHYLSSYLKNTNEIISKGKPAADVLVLSPLESLGLYSFNSMAQRNLSNQFRLLLESLQDAQVDYDIGDCSIIKELGNVKNGSFEVGLGRYRTVIVSDCVSIEKESVALLLQLKEQGGHIVFCNRLPILVSGEKSPVLKHFEKELVIMNSSRLWNKYFEWQGYQKKVEIISKFDSKVQSDYIINQRDCGNFYQCYIFNKDPDSQRSGEICFLGEGQICTVDIATGQEDVIECTTMEGKTYADFSCDEKKAVCYRMYFAKLKKVAKCNEVQRQKLKIERVEVACENVLTLDYATYEVDGEMQEKAQLFTITERLYALANKRNTAVNFRIFYSFTNYDYDGDLALAIESQGFLRVRMNGNTILDFPQDYFIDKSILRYDIGKYLAIGENKICLEGQFEKKSTAFDVATVHETEKNRFFYQTEIESAYILGSFDVASSGDFLKCSRYIAVKGGDFAITARKPKQACKDLTVQGLPFYRGVVDYFMFFEVNTPCRAKLLLKEFKGTFIEIFINNSPPLCGLFSDELIDITSYLSSKNAIRIRLHGGNRNCLGPHHHYKGEPNLVGVSTFKGTWGYEDEMVCCDVKLVTHTENYNFVPFGFYGGYIVIYDKDNSAK